MQALLLPLLLMTSPVAGAPAPAPPPPRIKEFFDYMKSSVAPDKPGQLKPRAPINPDVFLGYVSAKGLVFSDLNVRGQKPVSPDRLRKQLEHGRNQHFRTIVHLAMTIAQLAGDPSLPMQSDGDKLRIRVVNRYVLTFVTEGSVLKLQEIDFIDPEGC